MTYELASKLKNAGFPYGQFSFNTYFLEHNAPDDIEKIKKDIRHKGMGNSNYVIGVPTLSELIEACGDKFRFLEKSPEGYGWIAIADGGPKINNYNDNLTPEEAVANLWLALNEK